MRERNKTINLFRENGWRGRKWHAVARSTFDRIPTVPLILIDRSHFSEVIFNYCEASDLFGTH